MPPATLSLAGAPEFSKEEAAINDGAGSAPIHPNAQLAEPAIAIAANAPTTPALRLLIAVLFGPFTNTHFSNT